jgi:hypothetical protein
MYIDGKFYVNDTVKPTVRFVDFTGAAVDPDTISLKITNASTGTSLHEEYAIGDLTKDATGEYSVLFVTPATAQSIKCNFSGTLSGNPIQAEPAIFQTVNP